MKLTVVNRGSIEKNAVVELFESDRKDLQTRFEHWTWPQIGEYEEQPPDQPWLAVVQLVKIYNFFFENIFSRDFLDDQKDSCLITNHVDVFGCSCVWRNDQETFARNR